MPPFFLIPPSAAKQKRAKQKWCVWCVWCAGAESLYLLRMETCSSIWCVWYTWCADAIAASSIIVQLQDSEEGFLRHAHVADLLHALLASLLLFEKFSLS